MPNVDDHGLEVLKKAARDIGVTPKRDYALQVHIMNPEDISGSGPLGQKSGIANPGDFTGNPLVYAVTFITPYDDNDYSIGVTGEDARTFTVESKSATGFTINTNAATALVGNVFWQAMKVGEP